jgi:hypothetical protein
LVFYFILFGDILIIIKIMLNKVKKYLLYLFNIITVCMSFYPYREANIYLKEVNFFDIIIILDQGLITKIIHYSYIFGILFYFIWRYINYDKDNINNKS